MEYHGISWTPRLQGVNILAINVWVGTAGLEQETAEIQQMGLEAMGWVDAVPIKNHMSWVPCRKFGVYHRLDTYQYIPISGLFLVLHFTFENWQESSNL